MTLPVSRVTAMPFYPLHEPPATLPDGRPVHRLNLNESPLPPTASVIAAMAQAAAMAHHYPDGEAAALIGALATAAGIAPERVFVGAGSNELLAASAEISLDPGTAMVAPVPAFPTYAKLAALRAATFIGVPTLADGGIDLDAMLAAVTPQTRLMFVSSPHNPTGAVMPGDQIAHLAKALPDHVLLHFDEAYYEFGRAAGAAEALPILAARTGPWIITRTFSKAYGLAGARVGYGFAATPEIAQAIRKVRSNFSLSCMAIAAGLAAMKEPAASAALVGHILSERARIAAALTPRGFVALEGAANFLALLPPPGREDWLPALAERGILITSFRLGEQLALRITIGTVADGDAVIAALRDLAPAQSGHAARDASHG